MRFILFLAASIVFFFSSHAQMKNVDKAKILLIPLDDRPPCLQFTKRIGRIGYAEVISPPRNMLGRFTRPGKPDEIRQWLKELDLKSFDAAIISMDMIAFGGLVASRTYQINTSKAMERLNIINELRKRSPGMTILVQSVIMRIAPTADGKNEAYRAELAEWGVVSVATDEASKARTKELERKIPSGILTEYKKTRERDLSINLKSLDLLKNHVIDYLLLSQDDARPQGVHVADRKKIDLKIRESGLEDKVSVQAGTDEVSMLLLARALNKKYHYTPAIRVIYSSEKMSNKVMPYEDQPLRKTVREQIKSTGAREVLDASSADLYFYVFTSRFEEGAAERFTNEIRKRIADGGQVMIADIDPKGNVQGGDSAFAMDLENRDLLPQINSYASWNTAGNTIGTALAQGIVFSLAHARLMKTPQFSDSILTAQHWFTFHRVLDDFYYHNLVREYIKRLRNRGELGTKKKKQQNMKKITALCRGLMKKNFDELRNNYFGKKNIGYLKGISCNGPENMHFSFPWGRIFEARITFDLDCHSITK